jgi:hypothetical protein
MFPPQEFKFSDGLRIARFAKFDIADGAIGDAQDCGEALLTVALGFAEFLELDGKIHKENRRKAHEVLPPWGL